MKQDKYLSKSSINRIYLREMKNIKTKDIVNDDFDLLFDNKGENNSLRFSDRNDTNLQKNEKRFFSVFHFYFFIGLVVLISVIYLTFNIFINGSEDAKNKTFKQIIVENEDEEDFVDEEVLSDEDEFRNIIEENKITEKVNQDINDKSEVTKIVKEVNQDVNDIAVVEKEDVKQVHKNTEIEDDLNLPELVTNSKHKPTLLREQTIVQKSVEIQKPIQKTEVKQIVRMQKPIQKIEVKQIVRMQKPQARTIVTNPKPKQVSKPANFCNIPKKVGSKTPVISRSIKQNQIKMVKVKQVNKVNEIKPVEVKAIKTQVVKAPIQEQKPVETNTPQEEEIMLRPLRVVE